MLLRQSHVDAGGTPPVQEPPLPPEMPIPPEPPPTPPVKLR